MNFLNPPPAAFVISDDGALMVPTNRRAHTIGAFCAASPGPRWKTLARGFPPMTFGSVVMFLKTIPNGGLQKYIATTDMYIEWQGYDGLFLGRIVFIPNNCPSRIPKWTMTIIHRRGSATWQRW